MNEATIVALLIQQATLEGILSWSAEAQPGVPVEELQQESAAVLAGVMLMASGLSGRGAWCCPVWPGSRRPSSSELLRTGITFIVG